MIYNQLHSLLVSTLPGPGDQVWDKDKLRDCQRDLDMRSYEISSTKYLLIPIITLICCNFSPLLSLRSSFTRPTYPSSFLGTTNGEHNRNDLDREFEAAMQGLEHEVIRLEGSNELGAHNSSPYTVVRVDAYGARGDGISDDSEIFERAWKDACTNAPAAFIVPGNKKYLLKPITFSGPCRSHVKLLIQGTLLAPSNIEDWNNIGNERSQYWILFKNVAGLDVEGGGTINGNGEPWWYRSCKIDTSRPCEDAPTAVWFDSCKNLVVRNLNIKNSPQIQVSFDTCSNVQASNLIITAPEESPNTDGIHVTNTQGITIHNCVIGTGDDCISIVSGSKDVKATGITCGPGHGISIGSLGKENSEDHVSKVTVDGATIIGATNGVRIKTWQGGSGSANSIIFTNIVMKNVARPIIIDQNYCDSKSPCAEKDSAVEISNVVYKNIKGTTASDVALTFDCSKSVPCHNIYLQDVDLRGISGQSVRSTCTYVEGSAKGCIVPSPCF